MILTEDILRALFEPKRYALLSLMAERGYCVSALAVKTGLSESAVSQHLKVLREAGLVYGVKRGYFTHYSLDKTALDAVINELILVRDKEQSPCIKPFYGCSAAEEVGCPVSMKARKENENV